MKLDFRSQSAMEYLMTYGWAILIIAVVLGALFGLGLFNSANLAPKVGPGACQVYRPNGPGTTSFINLEGTCNNELPQYVAQFNGAITTNVIATTPQMSAVNGGYNTVSFWMFWKGGVQTEPISFSGNTNFQEYDLIFGSGSCAGFFGFHVQAYGGIYGVSSTSSLSNKWVQVTGVFNNGALTNDILYINGVQQSISSCQTVGTGAPGSNFQISGSAYNNEFTGLIANVQVYNTTLSANEITALYDEGIGGGPLLFNNLVGWWPLNGNANDYSGNLNNGASTGVVYTGSWTSGYTAP